MKPNHQIAAEVLEFFGLNQPGHNITALRIELDAKRLPFVQITRVLMDTPEPTHTFETREIVKATRRKRAGFDLDAACAAARARVQRAINESADFHSEQITAACELDRWLMNSRWRQNGMHINQTPWPFANPPLKGIY